MFAVRLELSFGAVLSAPPANRFLIGFFFLLRISQILYGRMNEHTNHLGKDYTHTPRVDDRYLPGVDHTRIHALAARYRPYRFSGPCGLHREARNAAAGPHGWMPARPSRRRPTRSTPTGQGPAS